MQCTSSPIEAYRRHMMNAQSLIVPRAVATNHSRLHRTPSLIRCRTLTSGMESASFLLRIPTTLMRIWPISRSICPDQIESIKRILGACRGHITEFFRMMSPQWPNNRKTGPRRDAFPEVERSYVCEHQYIHLRNMDTRPFLVLSESNWVRTYQLPPPDGVGRISTSLEQRSLGTRKTPGKHLLQWFGTLRALRCVDLHKSDVNSFM